MKREKNERGKYRVIFLVSCVIFVFCVSAVFLAQQKKLNGEFDRLVSDNLAVYTHGQRRQIHGMVMDGQNRLAGIAVMVEQMNLQQDEKALNEYLDKLSAENNIYQIDYAEKSQMQEWMQTSQAHGNEAYEKLMEGESVVSNIWYSERMEGKHVFAIAYPIRRNGQTVGVLRTFIDASFLTRFVQQPSMFQNVKSLVIDTSGQICYSDANQDLKYQSTGNLYTSMKLDGVQGQTAENIKNLIQENDSVSYRFEENGKEYFISSDKIKYNNWCIVNFVRSPDVLIRSDAIVRNVFLTGIILIVLTAIISMVIGVFMIRKKRRLDCELKRYATLSQFSDTLLFEYDYREDTLDFTSNAREKLYLKQLKIAHMSGEDYKMLLLHPDDIQVVRNIFRAAPKDSPDCILYAEMRLKNKEGVYTWFGCQYKYLLDADSIPYKIIGKLVDITDQKGREQNLVEQARKDILTDIYNKAGEEIINDLLLQHRTGTFFMIDLDHFKEVNDRCGHAAGDALLTQVGVVLKSIFSENDVMARVGGDEFVVFVPDSADITTAEKKAGLILQKLKEVKIEGCMIRSFSASIGVSFSPRDGSSYTQLYTAADKAMYNIKQTGKGGYELYSS